MDWVRYFLLESIAAVLVVGALNLDHSAVGLARVTPWVIGTQARFGTQSEGEFGWGGTSVKR